MQLTSLLPTTADVLILTREQLGNYILVWLNAEADGHYHGADSYAQNQRNVLNYVSDAYKDDEAVNRFSSAWRWLIDNEYIADDPRQMATGWFRLTAKGRAVRTVGQIAAPAVPREVHPASAPDFTPITADSGLLRHLRVLWDEGVLCYNAHAHLMTVIALGSLLEGVLLAKVAANPADANRAPASPKDRNGNVLPFENWTLADFIQVANQCGWLHKTRTDFSEVLRDYRNLVHPFKAKGLDYHIDHGVAAICWQVVIVALQDLGIAAQT